LKTAKLKSCARNIAAHPNQADRNCVRYLPHSSEPVVHVIVDEEFNCELKM